MQRKPLLEYYPSVSEIYWTSIYLNTLKPAMFVFVYMPDMSSALMWVFRLSAKT